MPRAAAPATLSKKRTASNQSTSSSNPALPLETRRGKKQRVVESEEEADSPSDGIAEVTNVLPSSLALSAKKRETKGRLVRASHNTRSKGKRPAVDDASGDGSDGDEASETLGSNSSNPAVGVPNAIPSTSKGKAREYPVNSESDELATLRNRVAEQEQTVESQKALLTSLFTSLQCQICLDLLSRPFTINPCGHVACLNCLQQWFRSSPTGANNNPIYSRKSCPCCRTTITSRPIESFTIKNAAYILATIPEFAPPASQDNLDTTPADPWEGIFAVARRSSDGIRDEEDGGIVRCNTCLYEIHGGVCAGCGREYDIDDEAGFYGADDVGGELFADAWSGNEDDDEETYEGSFIDDGEADAGFAGGFINRILGFGRWNGSDHDQEQGQEQDVVEEQAFYSDDGHASWDEDPLPALGRRQSQAIVISDSENDEDEEDEQDAPIRPGLLSRLRRPRAIDLLSDDDDDDDNEDGDAGAPGPSVRQRRYTHPNLQVAFATRSSIIGAGRRPILMSDDVDEPSDNDSDGNRSHEVDAGYDSAHSNESMGQPPSRASSVAGSTDSGARDYYDLDDD